MPVNVEIKARARDPRRQRGLAAALAPGPPEVLAQRDTFFHTPAGSSPGRRLKLRELGPDCGELIGYERPDAPGPKASTYSVAQTGEPAALRAVLAAALGVRGEVRKRRTVYLSGQTRIHFDQVQGLAGEFLELEVVLRPGQSRAAGEAVAAEVMRRLEVAADDLVAGAYIDLLLAATASAG